MEEEDLVCEILARVRAVQPLVTEAQALEVEREIRLKWGGDEVYVRKDMRRQPIARAKIKAAIALHGTNSEVAREHGVNRRTLYRLLKKE